MTAYRLEHGGHIDRQRPVQFVFNGKTLRGFAGDTLASALLANDHVMLARSFKYHRPRGLLCADSAEPNALLTVGQGPLAEPNCKATTVPLYDDLHADSQHHWPSLNWDIGAINGVLSPFLGAGFYYKTFMWPAAFWERVYEPLIRRAAGLGKASHQEDPARYRRMWLHCDLLVIGGGASGLMAALTAGRAGANVILADENAEAGGALRAYPDKQNGQGETRWLANMMSQLGALPNVCLMQNTTVFGAYDDGVCGALQVHSPAGQTITDEHAKQTVYRISSQHTVLCSGASERPLVFGGNDLPGVMLCSAMSLYLNHYGVAAGRRVAIFTTGDSGYRCALELIRAGVNVVALVDAHDAQSGQQLPVELRDLTIFRQARVINAKGRQRISAITIAHGGAEQTIAVDALAVSGGWNPNVHLACQRGEKPRWSDSAQAFIAPSNESLTTAGAVAGHYDLQRCLSGGVRAAEQALSALGISFDSTDIAPVDDPFDTNQQNLWLIEGSRGKAFVDLQNDVTDTDICAAAAEGYRHVEHAKRYTTTGMATDQGRSGNINAIGILAQISGQTPAQIGTTTFRPFYSPIAMGALAGQARGQQLQAQRRSPLQTWSEKQGAVFEPVGLWHRPAWYRRSGDRDGLDACNREVKAVRSGVGICDVSTLGKIDVQGPHALEFLNRIYCNNLSRLAIGKARYGLMLREDGFILDDGTIARLGEQHFVISTTTAAAGPVLSHMEFFAQAIWPELQLAISSVTDQWAQIAIAGPNARRLLQAMLDIDLSDRAFPFMSAREITLNNSALPPIRARLFRLSFSGELAYELAIPADYAQAIASALHTAGKPFQAVVYGTEAMNVMRIEKGHITHAEIDGRVVPDDFGLGKMAGKSSFFVGQAMLARPTLAADDRLQLVGLKAVDSNNQWQAGAQLLKTGDAATTINSQGHTSSTCYSPMLGHTIGLAMLAGGRQRTGETLIAWDALRNSQVTVRVCDAVFYDVDRARLMIGRDDDIGSPSVMSTTATAERLAGDSCAQAAGTACPALAAGTVLQNTPGLVWKVADVAQTWLAVDPTGERLDADADRPFLGQRALAPNQLMLLSDKPDDMDFTQGAVTGLSDRVVLLDQSQQRVRFELGGALAERVLASGCSVNLGLAALPLQQSTATQFGQIAIVLSRLDTQCFELICMRSFAQSLWQLVGDAARMAVAESERDQSVAH